MQQVLEQFALDPADICFERESAKRLFKTALVTSWVKIEKEDREAVQDFKSS